MAGRICKLSAKHTSNSGFDRTFMPCSGYFYALTNNERVTKYRGLSYSAKKTVHEICRATYSASQTRLRIYLTVSTTVVQSIENTPNHPKTPQTTQNTSHFHQPKPLPYILAISYNARFFLGHSWPFRGWGPWVRYWHCARIQTGIGLNDRQLF